MTKVNITTIREELEQLREARVEGNGFVATNTYAHSSEQKDWEKSKGKDIQIFIEATNGSLRVFGEDGSPSSWRPTWTDFMHTPEEAMKALRTLEVAYDLIDFNPAPRTQKSDIALETITINGVAYKKVEEDC